MHAQSSICSQLSYRIAPEATSLLLRRADGFTDAVTDSSDPFTDVMVPDVEGDHSWGIVETLHSKYDAIESGYLGPTRREKLMKRKRSSDSNPSAFSTHTAEVTREYSRSTIHSWPSESLGMGTTWGIHNEVLVEETHIEEILDHPNSSENLLYVGITAHQNLLPFRQSSEDETMASSDFPWESPTQTNPFENGTSFPHIVPDDNTSPIQFSPDTSMGWELIESKDGSLHQSTDDLPLLGESPQHSTSHQFEQSFEEQELTAESQASDQSIEWIQEAGVGESLDMEVEEPFSRSVSDEPYLHFMSSNGNTQSEHLQLEAERPSPTDASEDYQFRFESSNEDLHWDDFEGGEDDEEMSEFWQSDFERGDVGNNMGLGRPMDLGTLDNELAGERIVETEILIGGEGLDDVQVGSYWMAKEQTSERMLDRISTILSTVRRVEGDGQCAVLKLLSRNRKAWIYDKDAQMMRLMSRNLAFKSIRKQSPRFDMYVSVLEVCQELLSQGIIATKRDIYYRDVTKFKSQKMVDEIVEDLACTFAVPRHCLSVVAASKGLVSGALKIHMKDGSFIDCDQAGDQGLLIPPSEQIADLMTNAKFVLVVEKEATFRTLLSIGCASQLGPCIIITGKGYPDVSTRKLVRRLSEHQSVAMRTTGVSPTDVANIGEATVEGHGIEEKEYPPVFALVDCDPHGLEIFLCYKIGSKAMAFDSHNLATPRIQLLGLRPSDWIPYGVDFEKLAVLSARDRKKALRMLEWCNVAAFPDVRRDLQKMLFYGRKAEIQNVDGAVLVRDLLPAKLGGLVEG
ncbi:endodeoxyribonuclease [Rhizophlyctis rosea]|nr:endodeoxyribonuclease [Rhizophlyctis rosea]